ncbi:MAG: hypothetical protein Q4B14_02980, partial [Clostridia bacterium]|nr:hypothetical protein [Clostridia bacterium]
VGSKWRYFVDDAMLTGWVGNLPGWDGKCFYFDQTTGFAKSGWANDIPGWEGQWFYFDAINGTCVMYTNWIQLGDYFWFANEDGVMQTGWQFINWSGGANWFYFDTASGMMLKNTTTPDGYTVDANGVWVQ